MVYKNLLYRSFFAIILIILYFLTIYNNHLLIILATFIYLIIFYEIYVFFKKLFYVIFSYILLSLFCFYLYFFYFFNFFLFNLLICIIIFFDSFSYFTGLLIGKRFIFKKISPKKTLEGYLGGFFFTNLILISFLKSIDYVMSIYSLIFLINSMIIFSIFGDLIQSYFKRHNNLKNSSYYLPGHGGFFDRFDSFIPSIIFLLLYSI